MLQGLFALGLLTVAVAGSTSLAVGCSSPPFCEGGYIRTSPNAAPGTQGTCEGLCSPSLCANPGNVCVSNRCELQCTSELDCGAGQDCVPATTDGAAGAMVSICQANGKAPIGNACPFGSECSKLTACPDGSNCDYTQCGGGACTADPVACEGVTSCVVGKCSDGSACTVQGCAQTACVPLVCLTSGAGDATAYCTMDDCHADTDCPGGYWCGVTRDPHQICGQKAPPTYCGTTKDACVMTGGTTTTYATGPLCTLRNQCRVRKLCDPCETDVDCSDTPGQHCTTVGSSKSCTTACDTDTDCGSGFACTSVECVPRAGACLGTGTFCQPCRNDKDCTGGTFCNRESSGVERVCVLPAGLGKSCTTDNNCPTSPSGLHGKCFDETVGSSSGDGVYHTCYLPYVAGPGRFECWAGNTGAICTTNADCFSKKCVGASAVTQGNCQ